MGGEKGDFTDITDLQNEISFRDEPTEIKTGQDSKFETFFEKPYEEIKKVSDLHIADGAAVVDLGCGVGNLEDYIDSTKKRCKVDCADIDEEAIEKIKQKQFANTEVAPVVSDANEYLENYGKKNINVVLVNATLHEINNPEDQAGYLDTFFEKMNEVLGPDGKVIIGDYYYADEVSDEEVEKFIEYQRATINHADARNKFIKPDLLMQKAKEHGFTADPPKEIPAVSGIDRRYYTVVFSRVKSNE